MASLYAFAHNASPALVCLANSYSSLKKPSAILMEPMPTLSDRGNNCFLYSIATALITLAKNLYLPSRPKASLTVVSFSLVSPVTSTGLGQRTQERFTGGMVWLRQKGSTQLEVGDPWPRTPSPLHGHSYSPDKTSPSSARFR